ncbi:hypothetical protein Pcinc_041874, partial [Petrolisthes cinctipes]
QELYSEEVNTYNTTVYSAQ